MQETEKERGGYIRMVQLLPKDPGVSHFPRYECIKYRHFNKIQA